MKEIIKCQHCGKEMEKKTKTHKYCSPCNGIMNRLLDKKRREGK